MRSSEQENQLFWKNPYKRFTNHNNEKMVLEYLQTQTYGKKLDRKRHEQYHKIGVLNKSSRRQNQ